MFRSVEMKQNKQIYNPFGHLLQVQELFPCLHVEYGKLYLNHTGAAARLEGKHCKGIKQYQLYFLGRQDLKVCTFGMVFFAAPPPHCEYADHFFF